MSDTCYALSIKQPWAALVVAGKKKIEIRSWPTRIRGMVFIHAAKISDNRPEAWKWIDDELRPQTQFLGGVIGQAVLVDCHNYLEAATFLRDQDQHLNAPEWFRAPKMFGFEFREPTPLPFRAYPGNIRFFRVPNSGAT